MENSVPGAGMIQDYKLLQVRSGGGKEQLLEAVLLCQQNKFITEWKVHFSVSPVNKSYPIWRITKILVLLINI